MVGWGDPNCDAAAFRTILAYSPYENVRAQSYPAILALAGLTDPRVLLGTGEMDCPAAALAQIRGRFPLCHPMIPRC
jgi:hypothetical protein